MTDKLLPALLVLALLGVAAAPLAPVAAQPALHDPSAALEGEGVVVEDQATLDLRVRAGKTAASLDLNVDGQWVPTDGLVVDELSADSDLAQVQASFGPQSGYEMRLRLRAEDGSWGAWSAWTTGRLSAAVPVPAAGQTASQELQAEVRRSLGSPTIASSGYIRVKKLNSGG